MDARSHAKCHQGPALDTAQNSSWTTTGLAGPTRPPVNAPSQNVRFKLDYLTRSRRLARHIQGPQHIGCGVVSLLMQVIELFESGVVSCGTGLNQRLGHVNHAEGTRKKSRSQNRRGIH